MDQSNKQVLFTIHVYIFSLLGFATLISAIINHSPISEFFNASYLIVFGIIAFITKGKYFRLVSSTHTLIVHVLVAKILLTVSDGNPGAPIQTIVILYLSVLSIYLDNYKTAILIGVSYVVLMTVRMYLLFNNADHFIVLDQSAETTFSYLLIILIGIFSYSVPIYNHIKKQIAEHQRNTKKLYTRRKKIQSFQKQIDKSIEALEELSLKNSHEIRGPLTKVMIILNFWKTEGENWTLDEYQSFNIELSEALVLLEVKLIEIESLISDELIMLKQFDLADINLTQ